MAEIVDTLLLGPDEVQIMTSRYPSGVIFQLTHSEHKIQQYRITLGGEDEEEYYEFLLDNCIAMSSNNFYTRMKSDKRFAERMRARLNGE